MITSRIFCFRKFTYHGYLDPIFDYMTSLSVSKFGNDEVNFLKMISLPIRMKREKVAFFDRKSAAILFKTIKSFQKCDDCISAKVKNNTALAISIPFRV